MHYWCFPTIPIVLGGGRFHYSDVLISTTASPLFAQLLVQTQIKENIRVPRHCPLWGEPVISPHKRPVTRKMFPFYDVIIWYKTWPSQIMDSHCESRWSHYRRVFIMGISNDKTVFYVRHVCHLLGVRSYAQNIFLARMGILFTVSRFVVSKYIRFWLLFLIKV